MMAARLQRWLDIATMTSRQRWATGIIAVVSIAVALAATVTGTDDGLGWFSLALVALAAVAVIQPGSHTATVVIAVVVVRWLATADAVSGPRSLVVALCLLTFHGLLALMAVTPHSAAVHREVLRRWVLRGGAVGMVTTLVWLLARVLARRESAANPNLTLLALLAVGAGVLTLLRRAAR